MTARSVSAPHRSSLGYRRKRASSNKPKVRGWPKYEGEARILAFPGYKAGMSRVIYKEDRPKSHLANTNRITAVTVIETPPVILIGVRTYKMTPYGLKVLGEARTVSEHKHFKRFFNVPKEDRFEEQIKTIEENIDDVVQVRALVHTQPDLTGIKSNHPFLLEIKVGAKSPQDAIDWIKDRIGKELNIDDFTKPGQYVDAIGITKGKGFNGPVKRHGITLLQKKSKHTKRGVGSIAPWTPARVQWVLPRYGQLGYFRRTDYNKRVMDVGSDPEKINPLGGFVKYGFVKNRYVIVKGSVPGPKKRMVILRTGIRAQNKFIKEPEISYYSRLSQQGAAGRQEVDSKW